MTRTRPQAAAPIAVSVGLGAVVFVLDLALPLGAGIGASCVLMVLIGLWLPWRCAPLLLAMVATILIVLDGLLSAPAGPLRPAMTDRGLALGAVWLAAVLLTRRRTSEQALRDNAPTRTVFEPFAEAALLTAPRPGAGTGSRAGARAW
jgi:hypothetical protein